MSDDDRDLTIITNMPQTLGVVELNGDEQYITTVRLEYLRRSLDVLEALGYDSRTHVNLHWLPKSDGNGPYALAVEPDVKDQDAVLVAPRKEGSE